MSNFYEEVLKTYPLIPKRKTWTKDVSYKIRILKKKDSVDGIVKTFVDIREFIVNEKRAILTESGVYFTRQELNTLITILLEARKEIQEQNVQS